LPRSFLKPFKQAGKTLVPLSRDKAFEETRIKFLLWRMLKPDEVTTMRELTRPSGSTVAPHRKEL
jgi:hypothetical protein